MTHIFPYVNINIKNTEYSIGDIFSARSLTICDILSYLYVCVNKRKLSEFALTTYRLNMTALLIKQFYKRVRPRQSTAVYGKIYLIILLNVSLEFNE
jgi:hypothetical protein